MRTFFKLLGILLVLLIGILLWNTFRMKSLQLTGVPLAPSVPVGDSAIAHLSRAIQFRTISYADTSLSDSSQFDGFISYLDKIFPLTHATLKLEKINTYALLYRWQGSDPSLKPILLMGHYDVVPVIEGTEKLWKKDPFSGAVQDGYLYGRGTLDDKGTVLGLLESVEYLLQNKYTPTRTVYLAFGHDEEVSGHKGGQALAQTLEKRGVTLEMVLDEGGTIKSDGVAGLSNSVALVGIAEKGYTSLEITARGEGGHSSMPPRKTSIGLLAGALDKLENTPFASTLGGTVGEMLRYLGPEMPFGQKLAIANAWLLGPILIRSFSGTNSGAASTHTTIAPTILKAGIKDNVLPIEATATVNFRILPGDSIESVKNHVIRAIGNPEISVKAIQIFDSEPSSVSSPEANAFQTIHRTIKSCYPEVLVSPYLVLGATDSRYYRNLSKNIYRFSPTLLNEEDLDRIHGTNERIEENSYKKMIQFYTTLIKNLSND